MTGTASSPKLVPNSAAGPVWDKAEALDRLAGDTELLRDLASIFLAEYPKQIAALREALHHRNLEVATRIAHTIKGEVSQFCANVLTETSRQIEDAGHSGDPAGMITLLPALEIQGAALCRELANLAGPSRDH